MLDGAVLALANQRRTGQDDRQHGDLVDDLRQAAEPGLLQRRVEACAQLQAHRRLGAGAVALHELLHLAQHHLLDEATAVEGLAHAGGVGVELDLRVAPGQHVTLEIGWNDQGEGVDARVHARVDPRLVDQERRRELRRVERADDALRKLRLVLVDDGDRRVVQGFGHRGRRRIHREGEGEHGQHQHDRVAPQAPQFLDAQVVDVGQPLPHAQTSCLRSSAIAVPTITGTASSSGQKLADRSPKPSALLNTPRLMMNMWLAG